MLDNYPTGALNDRSAPYAQAEVSDECRYDHPDGEICQLVAELDCPYCEKRVCSEATTVRRLYGPGGVLTVEVCEACSLDYMVPKQTDLVIELLNRSMDHAMKRPGITVDIYLEIADMFMDCVARILNAMASRSHEHTEAVLRIVKVA